METWREDDILVIREETTTRKPRWRAFQQEEGISTGEKQE